MKSAETVRRGGGYRRSLYPGLITLTMVTGVAGSLGSPLVPVVAKSEHVSLALAQWTVTGALVVGAVFAPIVGRYGAGRRRKSVLIWTLIPAAAGALIGALPFGIWGYLIGRTILGLSFAVSSLLFSAAREFLPSRIQRRAFATLSVANVVSAGLAFPLISSIADWLGVKGAYWFAFGLMLFALLVAWLAVPESDQQVGAELDLRGAALLSVGTLALLIAVSQADQWGYESVPTLSLVALALIGYALARWWMLRAPAPLVDLRLAARPRAMGAHLAAALAGCGMYVLLSLVMVVAERAAHDGFGLGKSVMVAGLLMAPYGFASFLGNRFGLMLVSRLGPNVVVPLGCLVFAIANPALLT